MKKKFETALPYLVLCLCLLGTLWAALPQAEHEARGVSSSTVRARSFKGEKLPLRPYLPDEPVLFASLGLWQTHPGLDIACADVQALLDGSVERAYHDRLWGWCAEVASDGARILYRSLASLCVRGGDTVRAGDMIGRAGSAPCEAELGEHVHLEYILGGQTQDPYPLVQNAA